MDYLQKISTLSTTKKFEKGDIIITEDAGAPYSMYIILTGSVDVYKNYKSENEVQIAMLKAGDFFGEMSLYLMKPRAATVVAAEETRVLEIDHENAQSVLIEYPDFTQNVIKSLCMRIADLNQRLATKYSRL